MISPSAEYVAQRVAEGVTPEELALDLDITPRHARRLMRAQGWAPGPRTYTGARSIKVRVSPETYAALEARGQDPSTTAAALLELVADRAKLETERTTADQAATAAWGVGYLSAFLRRLELIR